MEVALFLLECEMPKKYCIYGIQQLQRIRVRTAKWVVLATSY